jgi:hypothetical protein
MTWKLSRFRAGDFVEIRSKEEILATLDQHGCFDGMPFMPEMLQFCGQRLRVRAVAHKTCDTVRKTGARRLEATVHLADLRCDGLAHGGCQAECSLFWKDEWLKSTTDNDNRPERRDTDGAESPIGGITEPELVANAIVPSVIDGDEQRYSCQATKLYEATEPLAEWNIRQYVLDVVTGNHSVGQVLRVAWLGSLRWLLERLPFGWRLAKAFNDWMHQILTGRPSPCLDPKIERGGKTPALRLDLKPGELVRIKSKTEIEETLDEVGNNRGLTFDREEMVPYCGQEFTVRSLVTRIIDEPTGKMLQMKQPGVILDGVVCTGEFASRKLNCPRAIPSYWREIWLQRVDKTRS